MRKVLAEVADSLLEGTIVGSFTKVGHHARAALFDWDDFDGDLRGQVALVTGGTSGIGKATAVGLLRLGADVHITSRSQDRADDVAAEMNERPDVTGRAIGQAVDTGDAESIHQLVRTLRASSVRLDVLISNAGALTSERRTDDRGVELTLSSHLIGPYLLMNELRTSLNSGARVLFMSSGGMYTQKLDVDSIELGPSEYKGAVAYAKAKRGQVEMVSLLGPEWAPQVIMHSVHPGWVATAGVDASLPGFSKVMSPLLRSAEQGADTMIWLAATGGNGEAPGQFWLDRQPRRTSYIPGTGTDDAERRKLVAWLDEMAVR